MKRTPWYPESIKPVREGVYECWYDGYPEEQHYPLMRRWTGSKWVFPTYGGESEFGLSERDQWRGLTKEAK